MTLAPPPQRTQIPNIVDDLGLDPYERALYVHYKRVCGENQGAYCYEAVKTTAHKVKMSTGQVSQARRSLTERGLILVQDSRPVVVTVVNIWELNTAFYLLEHRPDVDGWTVKQIKLWLHDMSTDVHTVNVSSHNDIDTRSPDETILTVDDLRSPGETSLTDNNNMSSYVHTVKQRIESINESLKEREESRASPLDDRQELAKQITETCGYDATSLRNGTRQKLEGALEVLERKQATPELVKKFGEEFWWGKSPPQPDQLTEEWTRFLQWLKKPNKTTKVRVTAL